MNWAGTSQISADPIVHALASAIKKDWTRIDAAWERIRIPHGIHIRRDMGLGADAFLLEALIGAKVKGILLLFIRELIYEELLAHDELLRMSELDGGPKWMLDSFCKGVPRPLNALLEGKGMLAACDHVCRVDIDGVHRGTGVQVSDALVATAAHVVEELTVLRADGSLVAADDSLGRLTLTFGYAEDFKDDQGFDTERQLGEVVSLHAEWLGWGSPRAASDSPADGFSVTSTFGIDADDGPWDVALIQLAEPRQKPRQVRLLTWAPPVKPYQISILHHPQGGLASGQPLLVSRGQIEESLGQPPVRCVHDAGTGQGSSGAPVFDGEWRIVALHQGSMQNNATKNGVVRNRAVPVRCWSPMIKSIERSRGDDPPFLTQLTTSMDLTPDPYPVLGRRETQRRVWRAMRSAATAHERLHIIRGEPGTGRRFTKRLIREMVTRTDGVVAALDMANTLNDSAAEFVERVAGALSAQLMLPDPPLLSTEQRAIRDDLVPILGQFLDKLAGDRAVWLVLEGFGDVPAAIPATVIDVISDLIGRLPDFPSLRLILVGWATTPPAGYERSVEQLRLPNVDDVFWYLRSPGDSADTQLLDMIRAHFVFHTKTHGVSYPAVQQLALGMSELLNREITAGDDP